MIRGLAAGLGAAALWGAVFVVTKGILPVVPPFTLLLLRLVLGALALGALWAWQGRRPRTGPGWTPRVWAGLVGMGLVGYGVSLGMQFVGTSLGTAGEASLITCTTPVFVALFAGPLLGERVGLRQVASLGLASLGVLAVLGPGLGNPGASSWTADLLLVGAGMTWALYTVGTARVARGLDLTLASLAGFLGGLPTALAGSAWELSTRGLGQVTPGIVAGVLFLGIVTTAGAMVMWNYAFRVLPASTAALTFFAQPVVGTLLGTLFLGETPGVLFFVGALLIGASLVTGRKP